jgi:DNA polymerase III epsilon subunit-like protein
MNGYLLIDTETTGLNEHEACVLEIGARVLDIKDSSIVLRPDTPAFHTLVRPFEDASIHPAALKVNNHYWCEDPQDPKYKEAKTIEDAWAALMAYLIKYYEKASWIIPVGWNVGFDEGFLKHAMYERINRPGRAQSVLEIEERWPFHYHKLDLLTICRYIHIKQGRVREGKPRIAYKLETMVEHCFSKLGEFAMHTALGDAEMALEVLHAVERGDDSG